MAELKGTIQVKAGNGKGFIIADVEGWFNCADVALLSKFNKGDKVIVSYEASGKIRKVTMISSDGPKEAAPAVQKAPEPVKQETPKPSSTGFACAVCGKELKDGKFKKCYECNMAGKLSEPTKEEKLPAELTGPKCVDCGVALKDDKYTKCFPCNKKNPVKKQWSGKKTNYDSPEKTAQIQKGNALNAAAAVLAGADCIKALDPEGIAQVTRLVADSLLDYLKQD
jgi:hypothetical protein